MMLMFNVVEVFPMIKKVLLAVVAILLVGCMRYVPPQTSTLSDGERAALIAALRSDSMFRKAVRQYGNDPWTLYAQFKQNIRECESEWQTEQSQIVSLAQLGATRRFELLPLVDWFANGGGLVGESGVSYLLRTDDATILFDVGFNPNDTDPSPLLRNMSRLGVQLSDVDAIVISHPHPDHIGGAKWVGKGTFSLTSHQIDLGKKTVFIPIPMTYPGLSPVCSTQPTIICKGVATIGVIMCPLFLGGATPEQAIIVNVQDKGSVIITGCGHPTISKLVERTRSLLRAPVVGVFGGFHLPLGEGRNVGRYYQYFVTGRVPWQPLTDVDVETQAQYLRAQGVNYVGISAHDSTDASIAIFKKEFRGPYYDIAVGKAILLE
jgi:7,8-dihydropterin-6-yl-methyl-4-(beta-D-ribofuranosyl)aminobenzene 5'-phosphate synthase